MKVELHDDKRHVDTYDIQLEPDGTGAGLIFDGGIRGQYTCNAVVELARAYGWDGTDSQEDIDANARVDGPPLWIDTSADAVEWLNGLTPEGWYFSWNDGDFVLANEGWWEEEF